ncbi:hypothetical protein MTO96_026119 [Rhipicephalus appendiculatus]
MTSSNVSSTGHLQPTPLSSKNQSIPPSLKLGKQPAPPLLKQQATTPSLKQQPTPPSLKQQSTPPSLKQQATTPSLKQQATTPSLKQQATTPSLKQKSTKPSLKQQSTPPTLKQQPTPPSLKQQSTPPSLKPLLSAQPLPQLPLSRPLTGQPITNFDSLFPDGYTDALAKQRSSVLTGQPQTLKSVVGNPPPMIDQRKFTRALMVDKKHPKVNEQVYQRRSNLLWGGAIFLVLVFFLITVGASLFSHTGDRRFTPTESQDPNYGARNDTFKDIVDNGNDSDVKFESTFTHSSRLDVEDDVATAYALYSENVPAPYDGVPDSTNSSHTHETAELNDNV